MLVRVRGGAGGPAQECSGGADIGSCVCQAVVLLSLMTPRFQCDVPSQVCELANSARRFSIVVPRQGSPVVLSRESSKPLLFHSIAIIPKERIPVLVTKQDQCASA